MNLLSRLELWTGRLPLGRLIETLFLAFLILCLAGLAGVLPAAHAQNPSDETTRHVATMGAIEKQAEAMIEMQKTLQIAITRIGGAPMAAQAPLVNPAAKTCDGFGSCLLGVFKATTEGVRDVVSAVAPLAAPYYAYKGQIVAADAQKVGFVEQTKQAAQRETTTQAAFATAASIANGGTTALATVAGIPQLPTTAVTVNGNGPVNTGTGTITNGSFNPVTNTNPAPVVVGTSTTVVSRGP